MRRNRGARDLNRKMAKESDEMIEIIATTLDKIIIINYLRWGSA